VGRRACAHTTHWMCKASKPARASGWVISRLLGAPLKTVIFRQVRSGKAVAIDLQSTSRVRGQPFQITVHHRPLLISRYHTSAQLQLQKSGLSASFHARVTAGGHVFLRKQASFDYAGKVSIQLPRVL
jgi:hypothetical protein